MKAQRNSVEWVVHLFLTLVVGISMSACSKTSWKEEVQLSDGRMIVVERKTLREGGGDEWAFNRSGTRPKEYLIQFVLPDDTKHFVKWHSTKLDRNLWPETPLILDAESGRMVLFTSTFDQTGCHIYSKYVYSGDAWSEELLPEQFEVQLANLLIREDIEMPGIVTLAFKRQVHEDVRSTREFLQIGPFRRACR